MGDVQDAIENAAQSASKDVSEAAEAFEQLTREGLNAAEAQRQLKTALDFATVANVKGAAAVELIGDALGAFNQGAEQSAEAANVLALGAVKAGLNVAEFAESIKTIGPAASDADLSLTDTAALVATLAQEGIEGGRAIGALGQVLGDLRDPASALSGELDRLGISSRDLNVVIAELGKRGIAAEDAFASLGDRGTLVLRALAKNGGDALRQLREEFAKTDGAVEAQAKVINDDLGASLANLGRAFDDARRKLAEPLLGPLGDELDEFTKAVREFADSQAFKQLQTVVLDAFKTLATEAKAFAASVDWPQLARDVAAFTETAGKKLSALAKEIGPVAANLVTLVDVVQRISATTAPLREVFENVSTGVAKWAATLGLGANELAKLGGELIGFDALVEHAGENSNMLADFILGIGEESTRTTIKVKGLGEQIEETGDAITDGAEKAKAGAEGVGDAVEGVAQSMSDLVEASAATYRALQKAIAEGAPPEEIEALEAGVAFITAEIKRLEEGSNKASTAISNLSPAGQAAAKAFEQTAAGLQQTEESADNAAEAVERIADAADDTAESVEGLGTSLDRIQASARQTTFELYGASEQFAKLLQLESQREAGISERGESALQADFRKQNEFYEQLLQTTRAQNAEFDETEQRLIRLRAQFAYLSEDRLRQLAQEQVALERNRRSAEREREELSRPPPSPRPTPTPGPGTGSRGDINVNIELNGVIVGGPNTLEELARRLIPEIRKLERRGF